MHLLGQIAVVCRLIDTRAWVLDGLLQLIIHPLCSLLAERNIACTLMTPVLKGDLGVSLAFFTIGRLSDIDSPEGFRGRFVWSEGTSTAIVHSHNTHVSARYGALFLHASLGHLPDAELLRIVR